MSTISWPHYDLRGYWARRCGDKVGYNSPTKAARGARRVELRNGEPVGSVEEYFCVNCGAFHVGHAHKVRH